jgi:hypothetical protein
MSDIYIVISFIFLFIFSFVFSLSLSLLPGDICPYGVCDTCILVSYVQIYMK